MPTYRRLDVGTLSGVRRALSSGSRVRCRERRPPRVEHVEGIGTSGGGHHAAHGQLTYFLVRVLGADSRAYHPYVRPAARGRAEAAARATYGDSGATRDRPRRAKQSQRGPIRSLTAIPARARGVERCSSRTPRSSTGRDHWFLAGARTRTFGLGDGGAAVLKGGRRLRQRSHRLTT